MKSCKIGLAAAMAKRMDLGNEAPGTREITEMTEETAPGTGEITTMTANDRETAAMISETYEELRDLDWVGIPETPYVMKYKFEENGYILMLSDLVAVYGEKLYGEALQDRFRILNPYAEMLPKVILKHVNMAVKKILAGEETDFKITFGLNKSTVRHKINISGFLFDFDLHMLADMEFKIQILRPILMRALIFDEEKATLQRKVEELEGRNFPSSSGNNERRNIKTIYSEVQKNSPPGSGIIRAFLFLQKDKIHMPESLESSSNVSPTKGIQSANARGKQPLPCKKMEEPKSKAENIPYEEDLDAKNILQTLFSAKVEKAELSEGEEKPKCQSQTAPSKKKKIMKF